MGEFDVSWMKNVLRVRWNTSKFNSSNTAYCSFIELRVVN